MTFAPLRTTLIRTLVRVAPLLAIATWPCAALAADYMAAEPFSGKKVRLDGALLEWPGGFEQLDKSAKGSGGAVQALVGYDERSLYVAAKVKDERIVRSAAAGQGEDHLSLELFFPAVGGGGTTRRLDIYPGDPGKLPGVVKLDGKLVSGAEAIEAPEGGGFILEAQIPWAALSEAQTRRVGLRAKLSYHDASAAGQLKSVVSTSLAQGDKMPPLTLGGETGLIQALLEPKNLSLTPAREAYGDVTGKGELERVALYGHFLSIVGPGYRDGKEFYFNELDVPSADQITRLSLQDFDGDGKAEIVLGKRLGTTQAYREVVQVLRLGADGAPAQIFVHELSLVTREGRVENKFKITGAGKDARIEISQGTSSGFEPDTFAEPTIGGGVPSALLPWESVGARIYGYKGQGLALLEEKPFTPKVKGKPSGARPAAAAAAAPKTAPAPRPPSSDEMLDRVYALYRKDRGVGSKKPRFDFVTDVAEDEQNERVLVHDKDIVVFGKGFKSGLGYATITMGVKEPRDVLAVTAQDLTGDGRAEIIVHAILNAQASRELGGDIVQRQALFIYSVLGDTITRVFAAETGRALKKDRIIGGVRFLPSARGYALELEALSAIGWTESSYPFPVDSSPAGGLEPLALPWSQAAARRYEFDGKAFVAR